VTRGLDEERVSAWLVDEVPGAVARTEQLADAALDAARRLGQDAAASACCLAAR
jgi:hypothetical protein